MSDILYVNDADFKTSVLESQVPVLVDFWAEWCGPCKAIGPVLEELAKEYGGKVAIAKMNVDENKETPVQFGIRSIPTLIMFKDGEAVDTLIGALPKAQLAAFLDKYC